MIKVTGIGKYEQQARALIKSKPELKQAIDIAVKRFRKNPQDTRLDTHALRKKLKGKHAFSVTDDIRIVFEYLGDNTVRFLAIGGHPQVYPRYQKPQA